MKTEEQLQKQYQMQLLHIPIHVADEKKRPGAPPCFILFSPHRLAVAGQALSSSLFFGYTVYTDRYHSRMCLCLCLLSLGTPRHLHCFLSWAALQVSVCKTPGHWFLWRLVCSTNWRNKNLASPTVCHIVSNLHIYSNF